MLVSEVLLVVRNAPFRVDRSPSADDTRQAVGRVRYESKQKTGVDGEVVHPLLGLLDKRVAEHLPSEILSNAIHLEKMTKIARERESGVGYMVHRSHRLSCSIETVLIGYTTVNT